MNKIKRRFINLLLIVPLMITPFVATSCAYLEELCNRMHITFLNTKADISTTTNSKGENEYSFVSSGQELIDKNPFFKKIYSTILLKPGLASTAENIFNILEIGRFKLVSGSEQKNILVYENATPINLEDLSINYEITKIMKNIDFTTKTVDGTEIKIPFTAFNFEDYANDIDCKIQVTVERKTDANNHSIINTTINYLLRLKDPKKTWKWFYTNYPMSLKFQISEQEKVTLIKSGINKKLINDNKNEIWLIVNSYNDFIRGNNAENVNNIGRFKQWLEGAPTIDSTNTETVSTDLELANKNIKKILGDIFKCLKGDVWQTDYNIPNSELILDYVDLSTDDNPNTFPKKNIDVILRKIEKISDNEMKIFLSFVKKSNVNWYGTVSDWLQNVNIELAIKCWFSADNKGNINFN